MVGRNLTEDKRVIHDGSKRIHRAHQHLTWRHRDHGRVIWRIEPDEDVISLYRGQLFEHAGERGRSHFRPTAAAAHGGRRNFAQRL